MIRKAFEREKLIIPNKFYVCLIDKGTCPITETFTLMLISAYE